MVAFLAGERVGNVPVTWQCLPSPSPPPYYYDTIYASPMHHIFSFSPHLLASIMQLSFSSTFLGVCFLRGATQKGHAGRAKRARGRPSLWPWSVVGVCMRPLPTSMWPWSPGARISCRVWLPCCSTPALSVLNNHVPCAHKVVTTCSFFYYYGQHISVSY
jgi:hypothetical protein